MKTLSAYQTASTLIIRILEQSKHGTVARNAKTKVEFLGLSAKQEELNVSQMMLMGKKMVYTPEVVDALGRYMENLRDGEGRLKQREKDAKMELGRYGVGRKEDGREGEGGNGGSNKERTMREIARVYGEMVKEVEEARGDILRLGGK